MTLLRSRGGISGLPIPCGWAFFTITAGICSEDECVPRGMCWHFGHVKLHNVHKLILLPITNKLDVLRWDSRSR